MQRVTSIVFLLVAAALAGCAGPSPPPTGDGDTTGTATGIAVTSAPTEAQPNSNATVCWRVEGSGNVPHTALHWDNETHPEDNTTFTAYDGGAAYPGNESAAAAAGYDLPGSFCSTIPVGRSDVYFRAHVIDSSGAPGMLGDERRIAVRGAGIGTGGAFVATTVDWVGEVPSTADPNSNVTVCWRVDGAPANGTVPHTAIHTDNTSHAAEPTAAFTAYEGPAYYPGNATAAEPQQVPGSFCTAVQAPDEGTIYLRAHVIDSTGGNGRLSITERSIAVAS